MKCGIDPGKHIAENIGANRTHCKSEHDNPYCSHNTILQRVITTNVTMAIRASINNTIGVLAGVTNVAVTRRETITAMKKRDNTRFASLSAAPSRDI